MARTLFALIAFALVAFALVASAVSAYKGDEMILTSHDVDLCMRDLPVVPGDFTQQIKDACQFNVWRAIYAGTERSALTPVVVECLQGYAQVSQQQVSTAQQCLVKRLSAPYGKTPWHYTVADKKEIESRVAKCLEGVPESAASVDGEKPQDLCVEYVRRGLKDGAWKESFEPKTVRCLKNAKFTVPKDVVAEAQSCLREKLDKDL